MTGIPEYSLVLGVDAGHMEHLKLAMDTWRKNRLSVLWRPVFIFTDDARLISEIRRIAPAAEYIVHSERGQIIEGDGRFFDPQRQHMLNGFLRTAAMCVDTPYWLKLDLDVLVQQTPAKQWEDPEWFENNPAIIAHRWGYTKPAEQMLDLDGWVAAYAKRLPELAAEEPLRLVPKQGSNKVCHERIISWCAFFSTEFTRMCESFAFKTTGVMPVPSQDGFMWYCARRLGFIVERVNMKRRGWVHCSGLRVMREQIRQRADCDCSPDDLCKPADPDVDPSNWDAPNW